MDETSEPAGHLIPFDHPETPEETIRRLEANEYWRNVEALERAGDEAESERQWEEAYWDGLRVGNTVDSVLDRCEWRRSGREDAKDLWRVLNGLGCVLFVARGRLQIEPVTVVPPKLLAHCLALPMREALETLCDECYSGE